jgi:hypothetical protein
MRIKNAKLKLSLLWARFTIWIFRAKGLTAFEFGEAIHIGRKLETTHKNSSQARRF